MFSKSTLQAACLTLLLAGGAISSSHAESFASSASSAGSASSGSISDSFGDSSDSSSHKDEVADGEYRVIDVAEAPGRADTVRLTLRGTESDRPNEFVLFVPRKALDGRLLDTGDRVLAQQRPYGFEFAHADTKQAFYLVLKDDWLHELDSHVVAL